MVTQNVCRQLQLPDEPMLSGEEVEKMNESELQKVVWGTELFVRMSPSQKERVIAALQHGGHSVAYLGDGVNDGPALRLADVGISVSTGVDIAKDVASIVLLRKSLSVIAEGVAEGRRIFANTIKYILMGTSSNFGNMFSAAGASLLLPFLPMTPTQLLLANSLYDVSQLSIPTDKVDSEAVTRPKKWDIKLIYRYMWIFGIISSIYDFMTFAILWFMFNARNASFQTGWFVESLLTQIAVVFIIRTGRAFYLSRPSNELLFTCLGIMALVVILPWLPMAHVFGIVQLPLRFFGVILLLVMTYLLIVEKIKGYVIKNA
jgi:Mg2+-importing ATPase